jgi:hypothetical protein
MSFRLPNNSATKFAKNWSSKAFNAGNKLANTAIKKLEGAETGEPCDPERTGANLGIGKTCKDPEAYCIEGTEPGDWGLKCRKPTPRFGQASIVEKPTTLVRSNSGKFAKDKWEQMKDDKTVDQRTDDNCCETFRTIMDMCKKQIAECEANGCCSQTPRSGGNKKSVKNIKRKNKVKTVKKKRSSQSGGKVHPWREHIKKTRLSNPGVKNFGQIIQMAKKTYKK